jgi:hypothetical protein
MEYRDDAALSNEYPARIVSPPGAAACCATNMVNVGDPQEERDRIFQYRRCPRRGFTVRRILRETPDEATLAELPSIRTHGPIKATPYEGSPRELNPTREKTDG